MWTLLVDYIESREQKLKAAEELHRFNRDVAEHEQSVAEKLHTMPQDLGRLVVLNNGLSVNFSLMPAVNHCTVFFVC